MRENTGSRTVETTNLINGGSATSRWTPEQTEKAEETVADYSAIHLEMDLDVNGYREDVQVFEYDRPGLRIVALVRNGAVETVFMISEDDTLRLHTAARTGRVLRVRYAKPTEDGTEVTRRDVEVQRVWTSKAGHVMVTAYDRRRDDTRSFRADRITHTTLHRQTTPVRPSKLALAAAFQAQVPSAAVTIPAPRRAPETVSVVTDVYSTQPGTAAALEAPEAVQDMIAERYALGHQFAFVTV